jgi:hypothetical protein
MQIGNARIVVQNQSGTELASIVVDIDLLRSPMLSDEIDRHPDNELGDMHLKIEIADCLKFLGDSELRLPLRNIRINIFDIRLFTRILSCTTWNSVLSRSG